MLSDLPFEIQLALKDSELKKVLGLCYLKQALSIWNQFKDNK